MNLNQLYGPAPAGPDCVGQIRVALDLALALGIAYADAYLVPPALRMVRRYVRPEVLAAVERGLGFAAPLPA